MADLIASMPLLTLEGGAYVQFEAVHPTTGNAVSGVKVSDARFTAIDLSGSDVAQPDVIVPKVAPNYFQNEEMV